MKAAITTGVLGLALLGGVGCNSYEKERPPVDQIDSRDEGLQSKEIVNASDKMAASILRDDNINGRKEQLIIVVDKMDDETTTEFPKDIFLRRLKTAIGQQGKGRVQLVENRDRLRAMQSRELEGGGAASDEFGQGGGGHAGGAPGPAGLQPDYALNGRITELRKQGTSYYYLEFNLTGLKGADARQIVWTDDFEVKVAR
jgi:hypothetical protein